MPDSPWAVPAFGHVERPREERGEHLDLAGEGLPLGLVGRGGARLLARRRLVGVAVDQLEGEADAPVAVGTRGQRLAQAGAPAWRAQPGKPVAPQMPAQAAQFGQQGLR